MKSDFNSEGMEIALGHAPIRSVKPWQPHGNEATTLLR